MTTTVPSCIVSRTFARMWYVGALVALCVCNANLLNRPLAAMRCGCVFRLVGFGVGASNSSIATSNPTPGMW